MGIAFVVMVLLIALLVQSQNLIRKNQQYTERKEELEQELKDQEIRAEEIENLKDYVNSTEFIEKVRPEINWDLSMKMRLSLRRKNKGPRKTGRESKKKHGAWTGRETACPGSIF